MIFKQEGHCPKCASKGAKIAHKTLLLHVDDISYIHEEFDYFICKNSACDVVYFNIINEFLTSQLNKSVGYKQSSSKDALICYCYNIKKEQLNEHTLAYIETKMEECPCACEQRNPYGSCCLKEIKKLQKNS